MKVTIGSVDTSGTSPYSAFSDSIGPLAKTTQDLAAMLGIMMQKDYSSSLDESWKGQKVAFIDQKGWRLDPAVCEHIQEIVDKQVHSKCLFPVKDTADRLACGSDFCCNTPRERRSESRQEFATSSMV